MSELETFGTYAREMSTAEHKRECVDRPITVRAVRYGVWTNEQPPFCPGCVSDADRALWARLAAECDTWLDSKREEGLFQ